MQVYYESGSYGCLDTTMLSYQDEMYADDVFVDASDLAHKGLVITRSTYEDGEYEDEVERCRIAEPIVAITPEEMEHVYAIALDGLVHFVRIDGVLCEVAADQILARFVREEA